MTITGTGPANDITILNNNQKSQHAGVPLPWSMTLPDTGSVFGLSAQTGSGDPSAKISCEIQVPGQPPALATSTGAFSIVNCTTSANGP